MPSSFFLAPLLGLFFATVPVHAGDSTQGKQASGGGDGRAKPKAAAVVVEELVTANEPPPPMPVGEERRAIGDRIQQHSSAIRECYEGRLRDRPTLQGRVMARFDIGPGGKVIGATAEGISDPQLLLCLVKEIRKWEFDKPASGGKLRVAYPWNFTPNPAN